MTAFDPAAGLQKHGSEALLARPRHTENHNRERNHTQGHRRRPGRPRPKKQFAPTYIDSATKEVEAFSAMYGPPPSLTLNIVEIPDDTVPSAWAPEIAIPSEK